MSRSKDLNLVWSATRVEPPHTSSVFLEKLTEARRRERVERHEAFWRHGPREALEVRQVGVP